MAVAEHIFNLLQKMEEDSDPRTMKWFFVPSPVPLAFIIALYYGGVYFGLRIMTTRPAFQLKNMLIVYNFLLILLCAWMVKEFALTSIFNQGFDVLYQPVDYSEDPMAVRVFFILRKKNNQVSFLHVYHHSTVPIIWYFIVRYIAGGAAYFSAMVNSFVHMLMHSYYFLSAFGPQMQPYLWWKPCVTILHLVEFNLVILHTGCSHYYDYCGFPRLIIVVGVLYCMSQTILFSNFFYNSYIAKKSKGRASIKIN